MKKWILGTRFGNYNIDRLGWYHLAREYWNFPLLCKKFKCYNSFSILDENMNFRHKVWKSQYWPPRLISPGAGILKFPLALQKIQILIQIFNFRLNKENTPPSENFGLFTFCKYHCRSPLWSITLLIIQNIIGWISWYITMCIIRIVPQSIYLDCIRSIIDCSPLTAQD